MDVENEVKEELVMLPVIISYDPARPGARDNIIRWCQVNLKFDGWSSLYGNYAVRPAPANDEEGKK